MQVIRRIRAECAIVNPYTHLLINDVMCAPQSLLSCASQTARMLHKASAHQVHVLVCGACAAPLRKCTLCMTCAFVWATLAFDGCDMVDGARGSWLLRPRLLVFVFPRFGMAGLHPPSTRLLVLSAVVGALPRIGELSLYGLTFVNLC
jgi:hypothetical protein